MKTEFASSVTSRSRTALQPIAKRRLRLFTSYVNWYLRRNFHGFHLLTLTALAELQAYPLLVCLNHPSWWDPLLGVYLSQRLFPEREHHAPIADEGLAKYRLLERLGFFGIDRNSGDGARRFLRAGEEALRRSDHALWVTPQGQFTDVRRRPIAIEAGLGHLARRLPGFAILPLALEYSFWDERYPEAFACFGKPILTSAKDNYSVAEWNGLFSSALERTADALAEHVQLRNPAIFESLFEGRAGVGGVYDAWRGCKAYLRGQAWQRQHGGK